MKTSKNIFKYIGILSFIVLFVQKNVAQCNCTPTGAFPATVNGITISASNTGDVTDYGSNYTSCGITAGPMYVGQNNSFSQTFTFSSPVNNVSYVITASSASSNAACGGEEFTFTIGSGVLTTSQCGTGCPFTQTGNTFCSTGADNGTIVILSSTSNYTSFTVSGAGGGNGSLAGLCLESFSSCVTPTLSVTPTYTICEGTTQTINVSGASTYSWIPSYSLNASTGDEVIANPTVTTTYTVIGTNGNGCTNTITTTVFVDPVPTPSFTFNTACVGSTTSFTDSSTPTNGTNAITNWLWDFENDGNIDAFTQNPDHVFSTAGTYTTNLYTIVLSTGCTSNVTQTVQVLSPPVITVSQNSPPSCAAGNKTLTATGAASYTWSPTTGLSINTGSVVMASPVSTSVYQIIGEAFGCTNTITTNVVVNTTLTAITSQTNVTCFNDNDGVALVTAQGGIGTYGYIWATTPTQTTQTATGLIAGNYSVVITNTTCSASGNELVTNGDFESGNTGFINAYTYLNSCAPGGIFGNSSTPDNYDINPIGTCYGLLDHNGTNSNVLHFIDLQGLNANAVMWSQSINVNSNSNYILSFWVLDEGGCNFQAQGSNFDVYINNVLIQSTNTGGCTTWVNKIYNWNSLATTTAIIEIRSGATNFNLGLAGMDPAFDDISFQECLMPCPVTKTITITEPPQVIITASSHTICAGNSATISALGANTYTWDAATTLNNANGASVIATPSITTNYTVTGANTNGCSNFTTTTVVVYTLPIISVTSNTICIGKTGNLIASGANTYTWNSATTLNANTGTTVTANPTTSTGYTVEGSDGNGCVNTQTTSVTVNNLPNVTVSPSFSMCSASTGTLIANGATTYSWFPSATLSATTGSVVNANPIATQTYIVIGEDAVTTCTNIAITTISVTTTPTISVVATSTLLCPQQSTTLSASGATTYVWLPFMTQGNSVIASPTTNTTYTVIGANSSCTNTAEIAITVAVNPTISVTTETVCSGTSASLTASGASSYTWSPTTFLNTNFSSTVISTTPNSMLYSVTGSSPLGCKSTETVMVSVISTPTITVVGNPLTICSGSTTVITANGASSYTWSPTASLSNANAASTIASPLTTTTFVVLGSNSLGSTLCTTSQSIAVRVLPKIQPLLSPNDEICEGQSTKIYATGGNVYQWFPAASVVKPNDSVTVVKPSATTIYTVVVSINNICPQTGTVQVTINPLPLVDAGRDTIINIDESIVLQGTGNVPIGFLSPDGNPLVCNWCSVVEVFPKETTCYVLEGFTDKGCKATDEVCIRVTKDWEVYIPNAFTPNGDLPNDYFLPQGYGITQLDLEIFNRLGTSIFKEENTTLGWDGYSKGVLCEQGVYIYRVMIKSMNGETNYRVGHLTLLPGKKK